jgi:hypothetical protein
MSDELEAAWERDAEGCWFDRADHEGELRPCRVERADLHMLTPARRRISDPRWGFEGRTPSESQPVTLCERHARMLRAEPA